MRVVPPLASTCAALAIAGLHPALPCVADGPAVAPVAIFEAKCAACHAGGGNVLSPLKTLKLEALQKNGYAEVEPLANLLRNGKGQMPKYQGAIPPVSRLTDDEIEAVATLVLDTAIAGTW